jgi:hypothetical protein
MMKTVNKITETERTGAEREKNGHFGCNVITKSKDGGKLKSGNPGLIAVNYLECQRLVFLTTCWIL